MRWSLITLEVSKSDFTGKVLASLKLGDREEVVPQEGQSQPEV